MPCGYCALPADSLLFTLKSLGKQVDILVPDYKLLRLGDIMSSIPAFDSGLQSIQKGMNGLKKNALEIANAKSSVTTNNNPGVNDVTKPLLDMKINRLQVEMGAKVIQASSDMIGSLLDIKA